MGIYHHNFDNLNLVIKDLASDRTLDFGCSSERLLPLYTSLHVPEVVGYDVPPKALEICRERCATGNFSFFSGELIGFAIPSSILRLGDLQPLLQHVPPQSINACSRR